jgi:hypothetical protein
VLRVLQAGAERIGLTRRLSQHGEENLSSLLASQSPSCILAAKMDVNDKTIGRAFYLDFGFLPFVNAESDPMFR